MTCNFPRSKYRHQKEAAWSYMGALEAKMEIALSLLRAGRAREARRWMEEAVSLTAWFDSLPNSPLLLNSLTTSTHAGGLPSGDKE
jgi:hypothetical protein